MLSFLILFALAGCSEGPNRFFESGGGDDSLNIGRMKVSVMPEYDDPSVLVIYDGRFADATRYPIKTSFIVPKGSVISDACSLSHEGQHFCQLYKTVNRGSFDEISLILPYPNFYLSFHTPRLDTAAEAKSIDYPIKVNNAVRTLEVEVQQPLRSSAFKVIPPDGAMKMPSDASTSLIRGFNREIYKLEDVAARQERGFHISYVKKDPNPSVDIKYTAAAMRDSTSRSAPYETQRNVKTVIYVLFGSGMLGVLGLLAWYLRARKSGSGNKP